MVTQHRTSEICELEKDNAEQLKELGMLPKETVETSYKNTAKEIGYIKENEIDVLLKQYAEPIYNNYHTILQRDTKELEKDISTYIIEKMNLCIGKTYRIGSTSIEDILNGLNDVITGLREVDSEKAQLALVCCEEFIVNIINILNTTK